MPSPGPPRTPAGDVVYNAFGAACPTREILTVISGKWVTLTLIALAGGAVRYGQLANRIGGVSHKMLTQTLRTLEAHGLVERTVTPTIPVTVDYSLTELGASLVPVVQAIKTWAETNVHRVRAVKSTYEPPPGGGAETAELVSARLTAAHG